MASRHTKFKSGVITLPDGSTITPEALSKQVNRMNQALLKTGTAQEKFARPNVPSDYFAIKDRAERDKRVFSAMRYVNPKNQQLVTKVFDGEKVTATKYWWEEDRAKRIEATTKAKHRLAKAQASPATYGGEELPLFEGERQDDLIDVAKRKLQRAKDASTKTSTRARYNLKKVREAEWNRTKLKAGANPDDYDDPRDAKVGVAVVVDTLLTFSTNNPNLDETEVADLIEDIRSMKTKDMRNLIENDLAFRSLVGYYRQLQSREDVTENQAQETIDRLRNAVKRYKK